jgi:hypothetical protein
VLVDRWVPLTARKQRGRCVEIIQPSSQLP